MTDIRQVVFAKMPGLRRLVEMHGQETIAEYTKKYLWSPGPSDERRTELLSVFSDLTARWFGETIAKNAVEQLREQWSVSLAEHHVPPCTPFAPSGTLARSIVSRAAGFTNTIVLSCASISVNNSSYPRGLFWHAPDFTIERLHFLPLKYRHQSVLAAAGYTLADALHFKTEIERSILAVEQKQLLTQLVNEVYLAPAVVQSATLAEQIARTNHALWQRLPGEAASNLLYIPQEDLVSELLLRVHLSANTSINRLLFDEHWRAAFVKHYAGLVGAFAADHGSVLFWGVHDRERVALRLVGNQLVSADGVLVVELSPMTLERALRDRVLMPTMALSFIVLAFYYGLTCGGGFRQVDYLPTHAAAWQKVLAAVGQEAGPLPSTDFLSADYSFLSLINRDRSVVATGMDVLLYGNEATAAELTKLVHTRTIAEALDSLMPEFYTIEQGGPVPLFISSPIPACLYV